MQLVVGLGNPGPAYADTRHNLGFLVIEAFAHRHGLRFAPGGAAYAAAAGETPAGPVVLLRPLTFMNRSGLAVAAWSRATGTPVAARATAPADPTAGAPAAAPGPAPVVPLAVCDDIALPLGAVRVRARGSCGGHRGLASLAQALGGEDFPRLRLGVAGAEGPPAPEAWADYVLAPFAPAERPAVAELVAYAAGALLEVLARGPAAAAPRVNRRGAPAAGDGAG